MVVCEAQGTNVRSYYYCIVSVFENSWIRLERRILVRVYRNSDPVLNAPVPHVHTRLRAITDSPEERSTDLLSPPGSPPNNRSPDSSSIIDHPRSPPPVLSDQTADTTSPSDRPRKCYTHVCCAFWPHTPYTPDGIERTGSTYAEYFLSLVTPTPPRGLSVNVRIPGRTQSVFTARGVSFAGWMKQVRTRWRSNGSEADDVGVSFPTAVSHGRPVPSQPRSGRVSSGFTLLFGQVLGRSLIARVSAPPGWIRRRPSTKVLMQRQYWIVPSQVLMRTRAAYNIGP